MVLLVKFCATESLNDLGMCVVKVTAECYPLGCAGYNITVMDNALKAIASVTAMMALNHNFKNTKYKKQNPLAPTLFGRKLSRKHLSITSLQNIVSDE